MGDFQCGREEKVLFFFLIKSFNRTYQKERKIYALAETLIKQGRCKVQRISGSTSDYM